MPTDFRETWLRLYGVERVVRTERTGSVKQLEAAHTAAVKAALAELHAAEMDRRYAEEAHKERPPRTWRAPRSNWVDARKGWPKVTYTFGTDKAPHCFTWEQVEYRPAATLRVGDIYIKPAERSQPDYGPGGIAWTIIAREGDTITGRSHLGEVRSADLGKVREGATVLVVIDAPEGAQTAVQAA